MLTRQTLMARIRPIGLKLGLVVGLALGLALPAQAVTTLYNGRMTSGQISGGGVPATPPPAMWGTNAGSTGLSGTSAPVTWVAADVQNSGATVAFPGGEIWYLSLTNPNPNTALGVTFQKDVVTIQNQGGTLMNGGGIGNFTTLTGSFFATGTIPPFTTQGPRTGTVQVTAGPNTFGGSMLMLLNYSGRVVFNVPGVGGISGNPANDHYPGTSEPAHYTQMLNPFIFTANPTTPVPLLIANTHWGWTTGMFVARDAQATATFTGFDNRTSMGTNGSLQLVTPGILHNRGLSVKSSAEVYRLDVNFAPEPGSTGLLAAGLAGLMGFAIVERRRRQR